jgi:hypothetical protein
MNARSAARLRRALSCLVATLAVLAPVAQANTLQVVARSVAAMARRRWRAW